MSRSGFGTRDALRHLPETRNGIDVCQRGHAAAIAAAIAAIRYSYAILSGRVFIRYACYFDYFDIAASFASLSLMIFSFARCYFSLILFSPAPQLPPRCYMLSYGADMPLPPCYCYYC